MTSIAQYQPIWIFTVSHGCFTSSILRCPLSCGRSRSGNDVPAFPWESSSLLWLLLNIRFACQEEKKIINLIFATLELHKRSIYFIDSLHGKMEGVGNNQRKERGRPRRKRTWESIAHMLKLQTCTTQPIRTLFGASSSCNTRTWWEKALNH